MILACAACGRRPAAAQLWAVSWLSGLLWLSSGSNCSFFSYFPSSRPRFPLPLFHICAFMRFIKSQCVLQTSRSENLSETFSRRDASLLHLPQFTSHIFIYFHFVFSLTSSDRNRWSSSRVFFSRTQSGTGSVTAIYPQCCDPKRDFSCLISFQFISIHLCILFWMCELKKMTDRLMNAQIRCMHFCERWGKARR